MADQAFFTRDFLDFFKNLTRNNSKTWFHANKADYEKQVKKPFEKFIDSLIIEIQQLDPTLHITAKDCVLRINRDLRFSKDKTPYHLHRTAFVSHGGRKDKTIPGLFLRFSLDSVGIMGGCYQPTTGQAQKIRQAIQKNSHSFRKLIHNQVFVDIFGSIQGDKMKRIPTDLKEAAAQDSLVKNKQWYFVAEREANLILSKRLLQEMLTFFHAARPVNDFLLQAIR